MIEIIIYCTFCYLVQFGTMLGKKSFSWGSFLLAPVTFPIELGAILGVNFIRQIMNRYTINCTVVQTKKALELGAPIPFITCHSSRGINEAIDGRNKNEYTLVDNFQQSGDYWCKVITIPTAEQMLGWLKEKMGITTFHIDYYPLHELYGYRIFAEECVLEGSIASALDTSKEATLAAIDAALDYLSKNKK